MHGALSRVAANAYLLAQASLPKAEASALLPVVDTSLSASVWNRENSFPRLYYALSSGFNSQITDLLSLEILLCFKIFKTVSQSFVEMVFSGPDVSPNSSLCTAHSILSNIWFRHASINNCSSIFNKSLKLNTGTSFPPRV